MKILGIDPGLQKCGYGCIEAEKMDVALIEAGVFGTDKGIALEQRLGQIADDIDELLSRFKPAAVAVEDLYSHYDHPKTAILMGHARGVILQRCAQADLQVKSYSATRIKKSVTGSGRASKTQVQRSIQSILRLPQVPSPDHVSDALAAAMCCANTLNF
jgi:crossover junction endodeoxyribonuclease RuvC